MDNLSAALPESSSVQSASVSQGANSLEAFGASGPWGASGHIGLAQVEESKPQDTSNNASDMNNNNDSGGLGVFEDDSLTGSVVTVEESGVGNVNSVVESVPSEPVVSEREKQAAALFGGIVGGDTSGSSSGGKQSSVRARRAARELAEEANNRWSCKRNQKRK